MQLLIITHLGIFVLPFTLFSALENIVSIHYFKNLKFQIQTMDSLVDHHHTQCTRLWLSGVWDGQDVCSHTLITGEVVSQTWLGLNLPTIFLSPMMRVRIKLTVGIYMQKQIVSHVSCSVLSAHEWDSHLINVMLASCNNRDIMRHEIAMTLKTIASSSFVHFHLTDIVSIQHIENGKCSSRHWIYQSIESKNTTASSSQVGKENRFTNKLKSQLNFV